MDIGLRFRRRTVWPVDTTFDDTATVLTFRNEVEGRRFARPFKEATILHRAARPGRSGGG